MRTAVEWRSSSKSNYEDFCKKHPSIKLTYDEWKNIIYTFSEKFKEYILETGEKAKLPLGLGEFSIVKKKRKKIKKDKDGREYGHKSEIEGRVADNPQKVRGDRVERLFFEEIGSNKVFTKSYLQGEALVTVMGRKIGTRIA